MLPRFHDRGIGQHDAESTANPYRAFDPNFTRMHFNDVTGNRKSQPCAGLDVADSGCVKILKNLLLVLGRDSCAGIDNTYQG